ncbi:MAG: alanine dehydrogenase [Bacteroidia bacterium]|nr:alanine dehydrogenase [Bacteroidia bacterium]
MDTFDYSKFQSKPAFSSPAFLPIPVEMPLKISRDRTPLKIGVPKETAFQEMRIPLTPGSVGVLVANGHLVYVEHNAGVGSNFPDNAYSEVGAVICYTQEQLYTSADIIVKIEPLTSKEIEFLQPRKIIISALNMGTTQREYIQALIDKNITAIAFEFMQSEDGSLPIVRMISEIAGIASIQIAAELLSRNTQGNGLLLGGITGVPPARVTIIGAGNVGINAARTALGMGAFVRVFDSEVHMLRRLEHELGQKVFTCITQQDYIAEAIKNSDVVIGAIHKGGQRTPHIVTEEMVSSMDNGSVIIDVSIDQGGCIETSEPTNHARPTFIKHGVIHYCVPNITSRVARTASAAISNILGPLILKIGNAGGITRVIAQDSTIRRGLYIYLRHITQRSLATHIGSEYKDIDLLIATNI